MNILMLSPANPFPPSTGGAVRIFNILIGLAKSNQITFIFPEKGGDVLLEIDNPNITLRPVRVNQDSISRKVGSLFSSLPYHVAYSNFQEIKAEIQNQLCTKQFDLIYLHYIYPLIYFTQPLATPIFVDQQNVDREYWNRKRLGYQSLPIKAIALLNKLKTIRFENKHLPLIFGYISVSQLDSQKTQKYAKSYLKHFIVAPNGVDPKKYMPNLKKIKVDQSTISLGFLGTLDLWSNQYSVVLLIRKILPELRKKLPDRAIQLIVIGRNPPKTLRHLAKNDSLVIVTGTVDSTADYLQKIDIMVLPIFEGAGTKLRCLEAMAAGIPIVGTELAFEGITGIIHGINASIAKDIDAFPQNIVDLVEDQDLRQKYSLEGRKLIEECYSWDDITKQLSQELFHLLVTG